MFKIEDERHAEQQPGEFSTFEDAIIELQRRASLPWDQAPNVAPCTSWKSCGRNYEVIEYDDSVCPWRELSRKAVLEIDSRGVRWNETLTQS
jgi:hypothetical protein